jgi:hypothetical protein
MLDLNHPMTPHIFRASGLEDGVLGRGQQMTVAPSAVRETLLAECLPLFAEMRELNQGHFGASSFIAQAIDDCESGIRQLAALGNGQITEDRRNGEGTCPYCGTTITKFNPLPDLLTCEIILCPKCDDLFMPALERLRSFEGFGTDAI